MKRKLFFVIALACCLVLAVGILAACNDSSQQTGGGVQPPATDYSAYVGRYYEVVNGQLDADSWIELYDDQTWIDSDTMMGTFAIEGSNIYFYWMTASEPMFDGAISDGEFTISLYGTLYTYKQGTPSVEQPEDPDEEDPDDEQPEEEYYTVSFSVNGGDSSVSSRQYKAGELMSLPTPTRDGYRFLGWYDAMGLRYDNTSVMPDNDLHLTARWEKVVSTYEDDYVYFKPATEGKKQESSFYYPYEGKGIHKYVYVELTSDNIGGPSRVGDENNLDLSRHVDMEFSVADGYTLTWYNDSDFTSVNGAQMFSLGYGSNIYFLTVSENTRVVRRYLIDFYVKQDYYISLYSNIDEALPYNTYNKTRVIEGEKLTLSDLTQKNERDFEFDKWVYYNETLDRFVEFDFDTVIQEDWSLYQTFKPQTITADLDGGSLDEELTITPYTTYQQLPIPTKDGYDFIGWQLADGGYIADITGYGSTIVLSDDNYFTSLKAEFRPKKYYKSVTDAGDTVAFVNTVPVVFYTDERRVEIYEIYYIPIGQLPYCPVPGAVPSEADEIFRGWRSYYGTAEAEVFDFNEAIDEPLSVFPELYETSLSSDIGIGNGYSFVGNGANFYHSIAVWLPSTARYTLTVSGKASISVAAYAGHAAANYTSTASRSAKITLQGNDPSGMYVYVTLTQTSGTVSLTLSGPTGYSDQSQKIDPTTAEYGEFGKEVLLEARENVGHTFLGWYNEEDVKVSGEATYDYTFTMPNSEVTYTAKWGRTSIVSEDTTKGTVSQLTETYLPGDEVSVTATTKPGYTFIGWYKGDEKVADSLTYEFTMSAENVTYMAKWIKVMVESEDTSKGTVSQLTGTYLPGDKASVTAITNSGYTFIGWYKGDEKIADSLTYEFTMPAENVTYMAKWIICPVNLGVSNSDAGSVSMADTTVAGERVTITATTNPGYTFIGWYKGDEKVADSLVYEFTMSAENVTYTAKWIKVTVESEDTSKGTVSQLTGTYLPEDTASVTATTKSGYTFIGWYNGEEKVADTLTYEFVMPAENVTYTAKWIKVTVESEDTTKGTVSQLTGTYLPGDTASVTATTKSGYTFIGWYNGDDKLTDSLTYEFTMPAENVTYTAKWEMNPEMEPFIFTSTPTSLTITGVKTKDATSLTIPAYVTDIAPDTFSGCNALASIEVDAGSVTYTSEDGILYNKAKTEFVHIPNALAGNVSVPYGITSIGDSAFSGRSGLTSITIPDSVTSIGDAFSGCNNITSATMPTIAINYIPQDSLQTVVLTSGDSIGSYAFLDCSSLTSITIPGSVTSIGEGAFSGCSGLTSITIPNSVTGIGSSAFSGCSSLESITIVFRRLSISVWIYLRHGVI